MPSVQGSDSNGDHNWMIFKSSLPHQQVIAMARDVLDIYCLTFVDGPGIKGCNRRKTEPCHGSRNENGIGFVPQNVYNYVGTRGATEEKAGLYLQCVVARSVQHEEDFDIGWTEAIRGATTCATEIVLVDVY